MGQSTSAPPSEWPSLRKHVGTAVERLQRGYQANQPAAVTALARLRQGVGKRPGTDPMLVELTTANLYPEGVPLPDAPTVREEAAYAAITLFAVHQQSKRAAGMHRPGVSLGAAARALPGSDSASGVQRRVTAIVSATSWESTVTHARGLIQLLRVEGVALDYGQLAEDLLTLQDPERAHWVRNRWGRDLFVAKHPEGADADAEADTASIAE